MKFIVKRIIQNNVILVDIILLLVMSFQIFHEFYSIIVTIQYSKCLGRSRALF